MATPIYINHGGISPATGLDGGREPEQNGRRRGDALASRGTGEEMTISLKVNGSRRSVPAEEVAPPFDCPPDLPVPSITR